MICAPDSFLIVDGTGNIVESIDITSAVVSIAGTYSSHLTASFDAYAVAVDSNSALYIGVGFMLLRFTPPYIANLTLTAVLLNVTCPYLTFDSAGTLWMNCVNPKSILSLSNTGILLRLHHRMRV